MKKSRCSLPSAITAIIIVLGASIDSAFASTETSTDASIEAQLKADFNLRAECTKNTSRTRNCLSAYLVSRCLNYSGTIHSMGTRSRACISTASKMVEFLDIEQHRVEEVSERNDQDPVEKSGLMLKQVLFSSRLKELFKLPSTRDRFEAYKLDFDQSNRFEKNRSLWERTFASEDSYRWNALEFIAVALQDASEGVGHLAYLAKDMETRQVAGNSFEVQNFLSAKEFLNSLFLNRLSQNLIPTYSLYPDLSGKEKELHPFIHHFYISAYLARHLKVDGANLESAFFLPFLLNASYEFVKLDGSTGNNRWPFSDPAPFDTAREEMRARKIYTGYLGALWGAGLENRAETYERFSTELAKDPFGKMRALYNTDFSETRF